MSVTNQNNNQTSSPTLENAALWKRLFAIVYDILIYFSIAIAYRAAMLAIQVQINGQPAAGQRTEMGSLETLGLVVILIGFCSVCWRYKGGQTLGMKAWRLQLRADSGGQLSWQQCIIRCVLAPIMLGLCGIGYFYSVFDKQSRCAHDIIIRTHMVLLPKGN